MTRTWPALSVAFGHAGRGGPAAAVLDRLIAALDDLAPQAIDDSAGSRWVVYFASPAARDAARAALAEPPWPDTLVVDPLDVPDENWAARSQQDLAPVLVGGILVTPRSFPLTIVIEPSMGFGTGHHESTRLCLRALQQVALAGRTVIDVGTGSGVLAIAAAKLGASRVEAIDADPDAVDAARANVARNAAGDRVHVRHAVLGDPQIAPAAVVVANITGTLLRRERGALERLVAPGGTLILGGFTADEAPAVADDYRRMAPEARLDENAWSALIVRRR